MTTHKLNTHSHNSQPSSTNSCLTDQNRHSYHSANAHKWTYNPTWQQPHYTKGIRRELKGKRITNKTKQSIALATIVQNKKKNGKSTIKGRQNCTSSWDIERLRKILQNIKLIYLFNPKWNNVPFGTERMKEKEKWCRNGVLVSPSTDSLKSSTRFCY